MPEPAVTPRNQISPRLRWGMITLVFWATVINYLDRQTLSLVAPILRDQFRMSNQVYSRIVFAFMLAYTIMNGVVGPFLDRVGTRVGFALSMAAWSACGALTALSRSAWDLGICRFLLGVAESGNFPAGAKVVAEWFPEQERALAAGLFNSGSAVGTVIAAPLIVWIVHYFGWPAAFVLVGALGFLWILFWWRLYYTPQQQRRTARAVRVPIWKLFRTRFVWTFTFSKIFLDPAWYFYVFWFPEYLKHARQFDMGSIGKYAWIPFMASVIGNYLGGWMSGFLLRRGMSLRVCQIISVTS